MGVFKLLLIEDLHYDSLQITDVLNAFCKENHIKIDIKVIMDGADAVDYIYCRGKYSSRIPINPDLIILDLNLPKIDGFDILNKIKLTPVTKGIPVVIFTNHLDENISDLCLQFKADDLVVKPVEYNDFENCIVDIAKNWVLPRTN